MTIKTSSYIIQIYDPKISEKAIEKYSNTFKYGICIISLEYLYAHHGILSALKNLSENMGIGHYDVAINLPSLYDTYEEGDEEYYFEEGVEFIYIDTVQVISNSEFISLLEEMLDIHKGESIAKECEKYMPLLKSIYN